MKRFLYLYLVLSFCYSAAAQQEDKIWVGSKFLFNFTDDSLSIDTIYSTVGGGYPSYTITNCNGDILGFNRFNFRNDSVLNHKNPFFLKTLNDTCVSSYLFNTFTSPFENNKVIAIIKNNYTYSYGSWHVANDSAIWDTISCLGFSDTISNIYKPSGWDKIRNGNTFWNIVTSNTNILAFRINNNGLQNYKHSYKQGTQQTKYFGSIRSEVKANNDGTQIAIIEDDGTNVLNLYDFNKSTGAVTYNKPLLTKAQLPSYNWCSGFYESVLDGIAFSQNDSLVYVSYAYSPICTDPYKMVRLIYQINRFHANPPSTAKLVTSKLSTTAYPQPGPSKFASMFTGPDGIIYWGEWQDSAIHTITNANSYGRAKQHYNTYVLSGNVNNRMSTSPSAYKRSGFEAFSSCRDSALAVYYGSDNLHRVAYYWGDGDSTVYDSSTIANGHKSLHRYDTSGIYLITQKSLYNNCGYGRTTKDSLAVSVAPRSFDFQITIDTSCKEATVTITDSISHSQYALVQWDTLGTDSLSYASSDTHTLTTSRTFTSADSIRIVYTLIGYAPSASHVACTTTLDTTIVIPFYPNPTASYLQIKGADTTTLASLDTFFSCFGSTSYILQTNDSIVTTVAQWTSGYDTLATHEQLKLPTESSITTPISFTASSTHGCLSLDTFTYRVLPKPTLALAIDSLFCVNEIGTFYAKSIGSNLDSISYISVLYDGLRFGGIDSVGFTLYTQNERIDTIEIHTITELGCRDTSYKRVEVYPNPTVTLAADTGICSGDSLQRTAIVAQVDSASLDWFVNQNRVLSTPLDAMRNEHSFTLKENSFGEYIVATKATSKFGCTAWDTSNITVYQNPSITPLADTIQNCINSQPTEIRFNTSAKDSFSILSWWNNVADPASVYSSAVASITLNKIQNVGSDQLTVEIRNHRTSCIDTATVWVHTYDIPTVKLAVDTICEGDTTLVSLSWQSTIALSNATLLVNGNELYSTNAPLNNEQVNLRLNQSAGTYNYLLRVENRFACADTAIKQANVLKRPIADFDILFKNSKNNLIQYDFMDMSLDHTSATLYFGDGTQRVLNPGFITSYNYADTGSYTVQLIVQNEGLCSDTTSKIHRVFPFAGFFIPTAITPNNDGLNDVLNFNTKYLKSIQLTISTRWGEKIMEINELSDLNSTINLIDGVYLLNGTLVDVFGKRHYFAQTFSVFR